MPPSHKMERKRMKWENDDYICRGHILNSLTGTLFDLYQNVECVKELCDALKAKYISEYMLQIINFLVSNFN